MRGTSLHRFPRVLGTARDRRNRQKRFRRVFDDGLSSQIARTSAASSLSCTVLLITSVCVNWRVRIFCFLEGALPGMGGVLWLDCLEKQRRALRGRNLPRDIQAPVRQWACRPLMTFCHQGPFLVAPWTLDSCLKKSTVDARQGFRPRDCFALVA